MSPSPSCTTAIEFTLQNTLRCHTKAINHLALSPDKTRLIACVSGGKGSVEGIVYRRNPRTGSLLSAQDSAMLWKIKGADLVPILSSPFISGGYGRCIQFCDNGASVVMYYLDNHECYKQRLCGSNHDGKLLLVSNLKGGIDEYQFPSMERVQTFTFPTEINCILQTKSLPQGNLIVIGGDDGFARVFNRISGQLVSEIHHGVHGQLVQVVEAFVDPGDRCIVVTATSGKAPYELKIWHYQPQKVPSMELSAAPPVKYSSSIFLIGALDISMLQYPARVE
ncbi:WD40-repeat-containing domain protein [Lactarius pseudohatsudake]|nr:WD40-repeat-containing domain protein [Lactarius pseudohatsudake]